MLKREHPRKQYINLYVIIQMPEIEATLKNDDNFEHHRILFFA